MSDVRDEQRYAGYCQAMENAGLPTGRIAPNKVSSVSTVSYTHLETVSTDYDTSDRLYFEPVTLEDVLEIVRIEKPKGVIVQYGGRCV